jgi:hypothetical protein
VAFSRPALLGPTVAYSTGRRRGPNMENTAGRVAPGLMPKVAFALDAFILLGSIAVSLPSREAMGASVHPGPAMGLVAVVVWAVTATALRHYDVHAGRSRFDDAAMVTILAMAVSTILAVLGLLPRMDRFLFTFLPLDIALRWAI